MIVEGKLMKNKRGFGFVCPDDGVDVFVSGRDNEWCHEWGYCTS